MQASFLRAAVKLRRLLGWTKPNRRSDEAPPIRARLLSAEQLRLRGGELARSHRTAPTARPDALLQRLVDNGQLIAKAVDLLEAAVQDERRMTPAGEWLLDNLHLIEEQVRIAQRHLPKGYSRQLPQLAAGPSAGLPRVYDIALTAISHGDGRIDAEGLSGLISTYQEHTPLFLGELWAVPIMLRLALIENLRRVSARVITDRVDRNLAEAWADALVDGARDDPKNLVLVLADMVRSEPPMSGAFVAELTRRLQGQGAALTMPLTWLEQWLADAGHGIERLVQGENQQQAQDQVSVSNAIASIRLLAMVDWREFVESMSVVEACLRRDPPGTYARMDFATRDQYRHAVERTARSSKLGELAVANLALGLAEARANVAGATDLQAHVGYYLIDAGLDTLRRVAAGGNAASPRADSGRKVALGYYLFPIAGFVALSCYEMLSSAPAAWRSGAMALALLMLAATALSELGVALVNWAATLLARPCTLPRLDFSSGIPDDARTLVVVPTMFGNVAALAKLVEALEVRFLANRDANLHFALLTDFFDADAAELPQDAALLAAAHEQIQALNQRHAPEHGDRFFLFHRARQWNKTQRRFIAYERKRGKLAALNRFLRGANADEFLLVAGNTARLGHVHYVITLDTDTQLPRDAARKFAGTLAHPLNRARFDEKRRCVTRGYGILQPRVGASMGEQRQSRYAHIHGTEPGIDPYTRAVSDVYQDLFGEGSFVGKGIYDVDAFEHALHGRFPEDSVLSHDLLEGCFVRAGLVSDVQLYEDFPATYAVDVKRRHRWIRGDWQLLPWLLPWLRRADGTRERNPLSWLARGKVVDNLRRSLVPGAMLALLAIGWLGLPQPLAWTLWVLSILFVPPMVATLMDLVTKPGDLPLPAHLRQAATAAVDNFRRAPIALACLPYEAWFSLDAIVRTLWRLAVTRRHLLQWAPSSEVERTAKRGWMASVRTMGVAPLVAVALGVGVARLNPGALWLALPVLALWFTSPLLMAWLGRPRPREAAALSEPQTAFLGQLARRTWLFFETYVGPEDHWLPPDNVQQHPSLVVAHRTSPTNIGLALLANLSALDFGYLTPTGLLARTAATLATLQALPRHRGHFYNWYDTQTLAPLPPRYISSVDSGNLAGHLATLRQGLLELPRQPVLPARTFQGLADTYGLLARAMGAALPESGALPAALIDGAIATPPATLELAYDQLGAISASAARLEIAAERLNDEAQLWAARLSAQCHAALLDLQPFLLGHHFRDAVADLPWAGRIPTLEEVARFTHAAGVPAGESLQALRELTGERLHEISRLADVADDCATMDFDFLYDRGRQLLSIGYSVDEHRLDGGYYDLLASEARLGNFVAIAQGQVPEDSWFALGRLLTSLDGTPALLSWSGSMFEYLMPQLVMPSYEGSLLDQTAKAAVERQIAHGRQRGVPWGVSESGYNTVDARMNYQYRAFGVPGLGLQRGLGQDLVIAPYASMLALMVAPEAACRNLQRLDDAGFGGRYGLHEAIDYTPARLPRGQKYAVVRSFMVHHQGMGLLALSYLLHDQPMQRRFVADAAFQATLLLLQERVPRTGAFHPHKAEVAGNAGVPEPYANQLRVFRTADTVRPAVQMLSNGRYHVLVTNAGGGFSRLRDLAVTRWREDPTRDHWGSFCYLRDVASGDFWGTSYQPTGVAVDGYEAIFSDAKAEFRGSSHGFETHTEIAVSAEDDIELRRLVICNRSRSPRMVEITSYAEVVLASAVSDELHPAFSNLFVQTELVPEKQAIVCTRRPRAHDEVPPWMFQLMAVHNADISEISYETDRARFIGRGNTLARPAALTGAAALSNTQGSVLDPVVATRCRLLLAPEQTATVDMVMGIGRDRAHCGALIDKYRDRHLADRVFDLAWTHSQVVRRQINASQADAQLYERLAGLVLYSHAALRAPARLLRQNRRGQSGLWGHAISGDFPIVLVKIADAANLELVRQMLQAHAYWRLKGLAVDLVIWNEDQAGYRQQLQDQLMGLVAAGVESQVFDRPGGVFVRPAQQISAEDRVLLQSVARVVLSDADGTLADQIARRPPVDALPALQPITEAALVSDVQLPAPPALAFDNGLGGFTLDGREYVVRLQPGHATPAPWSNVLANAQFGTVVSESTCGYTWAQNAHEFRLTPWHNDPVSDTGGEALYLRDEDSGRLWCPTALPRRGDGEYRVRHGFGYSVYEHVEDGIASELWVYVAKDDALKHFVLKLRNHSGRTRHLSATGYMEWTLGDLRARTAPYVVTELDADTGALIANNAYHGEFGEYVAFFAGEGGGDAHGIRSHTGDREEFLGRNGSLQAPAAMARARLSDRTGAGMDPCAALQLPVTLAPDESSELVFRLGLGRSRDEALQLAARHRGSAAAASELAAVQAYWKETLGVLQVHTPDPATDVLANGWLLYQTIACRYLGRSGYYQSGGAYGFRDQLQDCGAMMHAQPARAREHLLLCASRQFKEGDVQHWWHPPQGRGVRTRCSDDYLWLPQAACRYVAMTGDSAVLDSLAGYLEGRAVNDDEESYYDLPMGSALKETLYQHCVRALERGLALLGERGLPLMATGDWNDGMNRVGEAGRGESVWLGFFLHDALVRFSALAQQRRDAVFSERCLDAAEQLRVNLERHAWDGAWYRRAWFDDGTPLGTAQGQECRIDSISQSWSVLSGAGDPGRARMAMDAMDAQLVHRDTGVVQLLHPPFDHGGNDPGYIRGYVPGVRENGGQYTHAAIWASMAFAQLGDSARAWELMRLINPVNHARDPAQVATYKVEPYVAAADVYAVAPHVGRGGWTWYTGSAGWMYRLITESLLGLNRDGDALQFRPCLPADWPGYTLRYRHGSSVYHVQVTQQPGASAQLVLDGVVQPALSLPLRDDGAVHQVQVRIARP